MRRIPVFAALLLVAVGLAACDVFEVFEDEKETRGIVEDIGSDYLVVDGIRYEVNSKTEFEGVNGLADISVGDEVEVGYEGSGSTRTALEIEVGDEDDDDDGLFG